MPAHTRTTLINGLAAALAAAGTPAAARVYAERNQALAQSEFPLIVVKLANEHQERIAAGGGGPAGTILQRTLTVNVHYTQKQEQGYLAAGDDAARLIEIALATAVVPGLKDIVPAATLFDEETDGEHQLYTVSQEFTLTYLTTQGDPALSR